MQTRRSSRTNKGTHTKRIIEELYNDYDDTFGSESKKIHIEDREDDDEYMDDSRHIAGNTSDDGGNSSGEDDDGEVRCTPCGTTQDNYNEETDKGGMMIQCDSCKYWQHAKCMGYRSSKMIPKEYRCDECSNKNKKKNNVQPIEEYSLESLKEKHRISSAKAFLAFFRKSIPETYALPDGFDKDKLARKWTIDLENVIYKTASKKYNEESRRILFLIRRPNVIKQVLNNELTFGKLVTAPPEEVDLELKQYAEKVRQESIRRSVLTADDEAQRIRRTHKGEEIVEDVSNQSEDLDVNIAGRNIDHRRFKEDSPHTDIKVDKNRQPNYNFTLDDEDDQVIVDETIKDQLSNEETKSSELSDVDGESGSLVDSDDDETLKLIINGKPKPEEKKTPAQQQEKITLPTSLSTELWSGKITFPEFASFTAKGTFYSYSNYSEPNTAEAVKIHNKVINISKEILSRSSYEIEGRLDRRRADEYLNKIISTRDLCLVQISCVQDQIGYDKLFNYLLNKNKVGVLSGKPLFVKDSYLIAIDFNDPNLPQYLCSFKKNINVGLFAVYVVKKDYNPARSSILKKHSPVPQHQPTPRQTTEEPSNEMLSSILKQLNQPNDNPAQANPSTTYKNPINLANISNGYGKEFLSNLNSQQMVILNEICQQNPQIAENPEAYFQVLQTYLNIS